MTLYLSLFSMWFYCCISFVRGNFADSSSSRRKSSLIEQDTKLHPGSTNLVQNKTIFGAVIVSNVGVSSDSKQTELIQKRIEHVKVLSSQLPFKLTEWSAVFTSPCPVTPYKLKTERGLALAHYRIWQEFVNFDLELLHRNNQSIVNNKSGIQYPLKSQDGHYEIHANGDKYKYGQLYREEDILVIFEDDAEVQVKNINATLAKEFQNMNTDYLLLGWCWGKLQRQKVALCAHSYALTRSGARKMIQYFEPCGMAVDEQVIMMAHSKLLTYRFADKGSFSKKQFLKGFPQKNDPTFGIFHQKKKTLGSVNGH